MVVPHTKDNLLPLPVVRMFYLIQIIVLIFLQKTSCSCFPYIKHEILLLGQLQRVISLFLYIVLYTFCVCYLFLVSTYLLMVPYKYYKKQKSENWYSVCYTAISKINRRTGETILFFIFFSIK